MAQSSELRIDAVTENWPLAQAFVISRGSKTQAHVVVVHISDGEVSGRGESVPYARYGESVDASLALIKSCKARSRGELQSVMPAGAARNALDCAFWDLEAKRKGVSATTLAGMSELHPLETAYTLSLDTADAMAQEARRVRHLSILKLKLGADGDAERMRAVREARPDARLIIDANEAWSVDALSDLMAVAADVGVALIEQPLPAAADDVLSQVERPVAICADESALTSADLDKLVGRYDAVNIKLDKAGGLTEALAMRDLARAMGFKIMVGSMVATSLALAPALILAQGADWVDLDGPLLLAHDRPHGLIILDGWITPASPDLWG